MLSSQIEQFQQNPGVNGRTIQLLLPTVKLNEVNQPISIEYKMVHGLNQAAFKTQNFETLASLDLSSFRYVLEQL